MNRLIILIVPALACTSAYDIGDPGADDDITTPEVGTTGGTPGTTANDTPVGGQAATAPVSNRTLPFPCDQWDQGAALRMPPHALDHALAKIWSTTVGLDEARSKYLPLVASSGDLECVLRDALDDPRARVFLGGFYRGWLQLDDLPVKAPSDAPPRAPLELELMVRDAVDFAIEVSVAGSDNFARLYTSARPLTPASASVNLGTFSPMALSAGILSDPAVLYAGARGRTSPSAWGTWFNPTVLCQAIPPPPPDTSAPLRPTMGGSYRQALQASLASAACQGCHDLIDPPGFALAPFDEMGRVSDKDAFGFAFDTSGVINLDGLDTGFQDLNGLGRAVAGSLQGATCFARKWQEHLLAQGTNLEASTREAAGKLRKNGGSIKAVVADAVARWALATNL